jgi:RNA polymerase sigma-70 factor (ECF subfamily)
VAESHRAALLKYALALTRDAPDAEDLVQRTFERALVTEAEAPAPGRELAWLRVIMRNLSIDDGRREALHRRTIERERERMPLLPVDPSRPPAGLRLQLRRALREIPPAMAQAIVLVVVNGHTYAEVARLQGVAVGTVKSRVARARRALAEALSVETSGEDEGERDV